MKKILLIATLPLCLQLHANESGIEARNFRISGDHSNRNIGNTNQISGEVRLPIAPYTGLKLSSSLRKFNAQKNFLDSKTASAGIGLLFRKYDVGAIELDYEYRQIKADAPNSTLKEYNDLYAISGSYYFDRIDLGISRSRSKLRSGIAANVASINLAYYVTDNLNIAAIASGMDAKDTYQLAMTYQPRFLDNAASVSTSYFKTRIGNGFNINFSYFFDTKVSLINRLRRY